MEILVPQRYTVRQIKQAEARRDEFRPNRYTSGSANLDDMIATGRAVILCETHARKFSPEKAHYRAHPAKHLRRVIGMCDVCKENGLSFLFINGKDADDEERKVLKFKRALEYGHFYNG